MGGDVSAAISKLLFNEKTYGEIVHIAGAKAVTWGEVLDIYLRAIKDVTGQDIKVYYIEDWKDISVKCNRFYQAKYARAINREFSSEKLKNLVGEIVFVAPEIGLKECIEKFNENGSEFKTISWRLEAICDRITGERTKLKEFTRIKWKIGYIIARYVPLLVNYL